MTDDQRRRLAAEVGAIEAVRPVGGGCISPAFRAQLSSGSAVFVKTAPRAWPADAFAEEARSLSRLREAGALVVPRVLGVAADWLALEWLEPAPAGADGWAALGRGLARQHRLCGQAYGWESDHYIGPLRQFNRTAGGGGWAAFWRERRLLPQLEAAAPGLDARTVRDLERLLDRLDDRLGEPDGAALLHGDLWSGNVHFCSAGAGVVDPASCRGDREVDLAMAALFGGFAPEFFTAYVAQWPLRPGSGQRRPIYQLYYLLVHVVLFGGAYAARTAETVAAALRD